MSIEIIGISVKIDGEEKIISIEEAKEIWKKLDQFFAEPRPYRWTATSDPQVTWGNYPVYWYP